MQTHHDTSHAHRGRGFRWVAIGLGVLLAAVLVSWIVALLFFPWFFISYPPGFYAPIFWFPFGFLFLIFFFLFAARWLFAPWRWGWGWGHYRPYYQYPGDPVDILRYRYARGEITKEQFDQMRQDLESRPPPSSKL